MQFKKVSRLSLEKLAEGLKSGKYIVIKAPGKRGRKALSAAEKAKKIRALKREKRNEIKAKMPAVKDVFKLLHGKLEGMTLREIAGSYDAPERSLRKLLDRLVAREDLATLGSRYFLQRRLRGVGKKPRKADPVNLESIVSFLKKGPATASDIVKKLGFKSRQRLIRPLNELKQKGIIAAEGKTYSVAASS